MTNRFYIIEEHSGNKVALVERESKARALEAYAKFCGCHSVKLANSRDVASAFQEKILIISAPDVTTEEETKNEPT